MYAHIGSTKRKTLDSLPLWRGKEGGGVDIVIIVSCLISCSIKFPRNNMHKIIASYVWNKYIMWTLMEAATQKLKTVVIFDPPYQHYHVIFLKGTLKNVGQKLSIPTFKITSWLHFLLFLLFFFWFTIISSLSFLIDIFSSIQLLFEFSVPKVLRTRKYLKKIKRLNNVLSCYIII